MDATPTAPLYVTEAHPGPGLATPLIGATARRGGGRARSVAAGTRGAARCRAGAPTAEPGDAAGTTSRRSSPRSPGASASRVSRATSHGRPDATPGRRGGVVQSGAPHQGLDQHIPLAPDPCPPTGPVRCRDTLGGLLHDDYREAA